MEDLEVTHQEQNDVVDNSNVDAVEAVEENQDQVQENKEEQENQETQDDYSVELDKYNKFKFQGEEYTPEQFHELISENKRIKESGHGEDAKYWSNLDADLKKIQNNPQLISQFKQVYPKHFHRFVGQQNVTTKPIQTKKETSQNLPPEVRQEIDSLRQTVDELRLNNQQSAMQAELTQLDALVPDMLKQFPLASEDEVMARAEILSDKGVRITKAGWEKLFRTSHEGMRKRSDAFYKSEFKAQRDKSQKGLDVGSGGQAPGQAPVVPRTLAEATEAALKHLGGN